MDVIIFFCLVLNFFIQSNRKGNMHLELYKALNLVDQSESYNHTLFTGSFYKYPLVMIPYVEKLENLGIKDEEIYNKLKSQTKILWLSIFAIIGFMAYIFMFYE